MDENLSLVDNTNPMAAEAMINKPINNRMRIIFGIINLVERSISKFNYMLVVALLQMKKSN